MSTRESGKENQTEKADLAEKTNQTHLNKRGVGREGEREREEGGNRKSTLYAKDAANRR